MKKQIFIVMAGLLVLLTLSACAANNTPPNISSLSVTGSGQVYLVPDIAYIYIGVHSESESVSAAVNENTRSSQAISATLTELGIEGKDIQTTAFNVFPTQEYSPQGELIKSKFVVDNTVRISARDLNNLGALLEAVINAGANNISGIQFDVQDKNAAYAEARKLAIQNARDQADEIATAAGVELGKVMSLSVYNSGGGVPYYGEKQYSTGIGGGGDVPTASGQLLIAVDANILFEIK